jgi:TP901 family phage tail tape measure protein
MGKDLMLTIAANTASFEASMKRCAASVSEFQKMISTIQGAAFVYLGKQALDAADKLYNFTRSISTVGNEIQKMSRVFNMNTDDFQKWSYVAKMADVDIAEFGQGFKFLTRSMSEALQGTGDAAWAFNTLGISLKDSTGRTKDQQTVMMEVVGTLGKYADGANRDAVMLSIFGRGWMAFKPLIDQGTEAIEKNRKESERLNTILGKDMVKILSDSEATYKKWESVWTASKVTFWIPLVQMFTDLLDKVLRLKVAFEDLKPVEVQKKMVGEWWGGTDLPERYGGAPTGGYPTISEKRFEGWGATVRKPEIQGKFDFDKYYRSQKDYYESLSKNAEMLERTANPQFEAFWETLKGMDIDVVKLNKDTDTWFATVQENMKEFHYEAPLEGAWTEMGLSKAEFEYFRKTAKEATEARSEWAQVYSELNSDMMGWVDFGKNIADSFGSAFQGVIAGTEKMSDAFKRMGQNILSILEQSIMKLILFGNLTGEKNSTGGYGGLFGSVIKLVGSLVSPTPYAPPSAEGGVFNSPQVRLIGEAGPEAVIPLRGGKVPVEGGGGDTYVTFIEATDVDSFAKRYGGVIESINFRGKRFNKVAMR